MGSSGAGAPIGFAARYNSGSGTELSSISGLPVTVNDGNVTDWAVISSGGIDVGTGIVTAASFDGELSGNLSGSINASGISTIQNFGLYPSSTKWSRTRGSSCGVNPLFLAFSAIARTD